MFVDAPALVAILSRESGHKKLVDWIDEATTERLTSPLAIFETVTALCRKGGLNVDAAESAVLSFLSEAGIGIVPLAQREGNAALQAFARYGKGRGHPAQLNLGDCFAYACATVNDLPLLFIGNDSSQTDIPSAMA